MLLAPVAPDRLVNAGLCSVWGRVVVWREEGGGGGEDHSGTGR